jgi:two-component system, OmpR family, response regulator
MRILLVEDQIELARQITRRIKRDGFVVDHAATIADAREAIAVDAYSLAILDRRLSDGDGLSIVGEFRRKHPSSRVLMLTALDAVDDRVEGLDAGADDYLVKPFDLEELMARIRASLRRAGGDNLPPLTLGAVVFDLASRTASVAGGSALFHNRELALLEALMRRAGVIVRRETLMSEIWGFDDEVHPHALTLLVGRLRQRLDQLETGLQIHSARGIGYLIAEKRA